MPIEITLTPQLSATTPASTAISSLSQSLRASRSPQSQALADALDELQRGIQTIEKLLRNPPSIQGDDIQILNARGELGLRITDTSLSIAGLQILTIRGAAVTSVSGTAGATYGAAEQAIINALVVAVNALISRLSASGGGHGLIA